MLVLMIVSGQRTSFRCILAPSGSFATDPDAASEPLPPDPDKVSFLLVSSRWDNLTAEWTTSRQSALSYGPFNPSGSKDIQHRTLRIVLIPRDAINRSFSVGSGFR